MLVLAWAIQAAALRGWSDAEYYSARRAIAKWDAPARTPEADWRRAQAALEGAYGREPDNPLYAEELGRVHEWRALARAAPDPGARTQLRAALASFRAAARMRPASAAAWANIALVKFRLEEMDYEFYGALDRAERMGPWEPFVQRSLADIGFASWSWLAAPGREIAAGAIERGLVNQEEAIKRVARLHPHGARAFCADALVRARRVGALCPPR
jgi:hypothetical protein